MTGPQTLNLLTADVRELQRLFQSGALKSIDLVQLYTQQIQRQDGYLRAMLNFQPQERTMASALALDRERAAGKLRGPLHGLPIVLKDNIDTHPDLGFETTAGNFALKGSWPSANAKIVDMLLAAGVIILGKTNLSELANWKGINITSGWSAIGGQVQSAYTTGDVNPDDGKDGHSNPSGSSSGSAVAVSAGYSPFAIGTETDGSLIVPSGRAALYTMKPTIGLVSREGIVPVSHTFDSPGPMAKTPYDLAALLDAIADPSQKPVDSYVSALTASWSDISVATVDPEIWTFPDEWCRPVEDATNQMRHEIHEAFAKIGKLAKSYTEKVPLIGVDAFLDSGKNTKLEVTNADFTNDIKAYLETRDHPRVKDLRELIEFNKEHTDQELPPYAPNQHKLIGAFEQSITSEQYEADLKHVREVARRRGIDYILDKYQVDVIMAPADSLLISLAAGSGYPIATLPLGYLNMNGRPFGLSVIARAHQERTLIEVQSAWEATFGPRRPPPLENSSPVLDAN